MQAEVKAVEAGAVRELVAEHASLVAVDRIATQPVSLLRSGNNTMAGRQPPAIYYEENRNKKKSKAVKAYSFEKKSKAPETKLDKE